MWKKRKAGTLEMELCSFSFSAREGNPTHAHVQIVDACAMLATRTRDGWRKPLKSEKGGEPPWTETRGNIFFHMFLMNCFLKNPPKGEKQLVTPDIPQAFVQPVLVVAVSSSVEKEGRCPWNVHSKSITFWIRIQVIFLIYF